MFTLTEINPAVEVPESEYQRLLGYPRQHSLEGRARELADGARAWFSKDGHPWICAREISSVEFRDKKVSIGEKEFSSQRLHQLFAESDVHTAVLVAVSAGRECEEYARQLWEEGKPDEYFFLEVLGSAVVEQLIVLANAHICGWADDNKLAALPYFSPGYSGWDIAEQISLWNLFRERFDGGFPGALEVMESGMLRPKKSQLTVVGLTHELEKARRFSRLIPCESCSLPNCRYRRGPYKRSRAPVEVPGRSHP
ncbi:MAG TPA: hypothetical protein VKV04_17455 [Verrucomicrobiae bacterium]|nr:hypothetical protein [Verrucomicrobiae bacterium]